MGCSVTAGDHQDNLEIYISLMRDSVFSRSVRKHLLMLPQQLRACDRHNLVRVAVATSARDSVTYAATSIVLIQVGREKTSQMNPHSR